MSEVRDKKVERSLDSTVFYQNNKLNYFFTLLAVILSCGFMIAIAFILQMLLDVATSGTMSDLVHMLKLCVIYIIGFIVVMLIKRTFTGRFVKRAMEQYRNQIFRKVLEKNINAFNEESQSVYISALTNDMKTIETNYLLGNINLVIQAITFVGGIGAMAYYNVWITLVVLVLCAIPILASSIFGGKIVECEKELSKNNSHFVALVKDLCSGFPIIKSFKAEGKTLDLFHRMTVQLETTSKRRRDTSATIGIVNQVSAEIVNFGLFGVGAYFAIQGKITIGVVVAFIQLLNYVVGPIERFSPIFMERKAAIALMNRLSDLVTSKEDEHDYEFIPSFEEKIEFKNVVFKYPEAENNTLKGIDLTFEKDKKYALVGGSGSGKSTLINLLLGYYKSYEGSICIDDKNMANLSLDNVYDLISVIQQNVFIFDSTIKNNITMFDDFDEDKIQAAIEGAGLKELIKNKGLDYACGENGCNLSGGEKQRISIARCLLRNTPIMLMDEATSALDVNTCMLIENGILQIKDLTRIIITHKLEKETLKKYDSIVALSNGEVVEQGTFDELMERKEYFYSLYMINK